MNTGHHATRRPALQPHRRQGVAALTVVMILFFVMAMVAAYTNRNLIFEQRISTNSYRANRALEAADAGVEWTVAMLNGGRIDANCQPSITPADSDFRDRYHNAAASPANGQDDAYDVKWANVQNDRVYPACVNREGVLSCICPMMRPALLPPFGGAADGLGSAFRVEFLRPGNAVWPGAIAFASRGCASVGEGDRACTSQTHDALPTVDGLSGAVTTVGLVRALPIPPIAALTAGSSISITGGGTLNISNANAATGMAIHAGGTLPTATPPNVVYTGLSLPKDPALADLGPEANDGVWFRNMFGMDATTFQRQPAARVINCAGGCTSASLTNVLLGYPRNPMWVNGDLDLNTAEKFGQFTGGRKEPLMLIVTGRLTISNRVEIVGFVHADSIDWAAGAAGASVQGAMVAKKTFTAYSPAVLTYDRAVLDDISLRYGSFVRAPGSWNLRIQ